MQTQKGEKEKEQNNRFKFPSKKQGVKLRPSFTKKTSCRDATGTHPRKKGHGEKTLNEEIATFILRQVLGGKKRKKTKRGTHLTAGKSAKKKGKIKKDN